MKEKLKKIGKYLGGFSFASAICLTPALFVNAANVTKYLDDTGLSNSLGKGNLPQMIGTLINVLLGILGLLLVLLILWAGFIWMTAQGDPDKTKKSRDMIFQAVIGLLIIFASYAIANFVIARLTDVTGTS